MLQLISVPEVPRKLTLLDVLFAILASLVIPDLVFLALNTLFSAVHISYTIQTIVSFWIIIFVVKFLQLEKSSK